MSKEHHKECSMCKEFKPLSEYNAQSDAEDKYRSNCKACESKMQKIYGETKKYKISLGIFKNKKMSSSEKKLCAYAIMHKRSITKSEQLPEPYFDMSNISTDDLMIEYFKRIDNDELTKFPDPRKNKIRRMK